MEKTFKYTVFPTLFSLLSLLWQAYAQNDSSLCDNNLSVLKELNKQKKYKEATDLWKETYKYCKTYNKRIFLYGINILSDEIENEKDNKRKSILVDSLMNLYQERIIYFGREGLTIGRQGVDLLRYDETKTLEAYRLLKKSMKLQGLNAEPAIILSLMQASEVLFINGVIDRKQVESDYIKCKNNIEEQLKCGKTENEKYILEQAYSGINQIFFHFRPVDCDELAYNLEGIFEKRKNNLKSLEKIAKILVSKNCDSCDFYKKVIAKIDSFPPAYTIKDVLPITKESVLDSIKTLKASLTYEKVDSLKARKLQEISVLYRKIDELKKSREFAYKAIEHAANYGAPYILLAILYVESSNSHSNSFVKYALYLVAIDKLLMAKELDSSVEDAANKLIAMFNKELPTIKEINYHRQKTGNTYHISGWINETTIIRARK